MPQRQQELLSRHLPDAVAMTKSLKTDVQLSLFLSPCCWFNSSLFFRHRSFYCDLLFLQHFHKLEGIWTVEAQGSAQLIVPILNPVIDSDTGIKDIPHWNRERDIQSSVLEVLG